MTIDFSAIEKDILAQSEALAQSLVKDFSKQGMAALRAYLATSKEDLVRWTGELGEGQITKDEFQDLVKGQIITALLAGLEESGLAQVELDKFANGVVQIMVAVAFDAAKSIV